MVTKSNVSVLDLCTCSKTIFLVYKDSSCFVSKFLVSSSLLLSSVSSLVSCPSCEYSHSSLSISLGQRVLEESTPHCMEYYVAFFLYLTSSTLTVDLPSAFASNCNDPSDKQDNTCRSTWQPHEPINILLDNVSSQSTTGSISTTNKPSSQGFSRFLKSSLVIVCLLDTIINDVTWLSKQELLLGGAGYYWGGSSLPSPLVPTPLLHIECLIACIKILE